MRHAFTLLEMLLTLAMSVVLMGLISGAIGFYARDMASAEDEFRQSQIAMSVLQMIEDDLRMTQVTRPIDTAALAEVLSSAASPLEQAGMGSMTGATDSELPPEDSTPEGSTPEDSTAEDSTAEDPAMLDATTGVGTLQAPGLIGNISQLQVDVSRLPTLESYAVNPAMVGVGTAGELADRPSDLKTVSYFVVAAGTVGPVDPLEMLAGTTNGQSSGQAACGGGLVRRSIDRAISTQASASGGLSRLLQSGELIAPEITAIEFEYFDGVIWLSQFSSDDSGFLPRAIRVTLTMGSVGESVETVNAPEPRSFTHVISLPMSFPEDAEATEAMEPAATDLGLDRPGGPVLPLPGPSGPGSWYDNPWQAPKGRHTWLSSPSVGPSGLWATHRTDDRRLMPQADHVTALRALAVTIHLHRFVENA